MEYIFTFLVSVAADVTSRFICKWLDRYDENRKAQLKGKPPGSSRLLGGFSIGVKPMEYSHS